MQINTIILTNMVFYCIGSAFFVVTSIRSSTSAYKSICWLFIVNDSGHLLHFSQCSIRFLI